MNFSAVILAAGQSSRMGRDKAWIDCGGQPLLARQIECVRAAGAAEVFISGRPNVDYSGLGCPVLLDQISDAGPLAGIAQALEAARNPLLLVLAVDMPYVTSEFLRELRRHSDGTHGVIPQVGEFIEPLAAFYPKAAATLLRDMLSQADGPVPGARHFAHACVGVELAKLVTVPPENAPLFRSWNTPDDVAPAERLCHLAREKL